MVIRIYFLKCFLDLALLHFGISFAKNKYWILKLNAQAQMILGFKHDSIALRWMVFFQSPQYQTGSWKGEWSREVSREVNILCLFLLLLKAFKWCFTVLPLKVSHEWQFVTELILTCLCATINWWKILWIWSGYSCLNWV